MSTSTTATCAPNGNVAPCGREVVLGAQRLAVVLGRGGDLGPDDGRAGHAGDAGTPPSVDLDVVRLASSSDAAMSRARASTRSAAPRPRCRRAAASASRRCPGRAGRPRCRTARSRIDSIGTPSWSADDHRERRGVALAVRRRAGPDGDRAVACDLDDAELAAAATGDLDVAGRARCRAAARRRAGPALGLLGAAARRSRRSAAPRRGPGRSRRCRTSSRSASCRGRRPCPASCGAGSRPGRGRARRPRGR